MRCYMAVLQALDTEPQTNRMSGRHFGPRMSADIVHCELTRYEFAEGLGLTPDSIFVENLFKMVDTNDNGYISFREFLDFFVIFSKGTACSVIFILVRGSD